MPSDHLLEYCDYFYNKGIIILWNGQHQVFDDMKEWWKEEFPNWVWMNNPGSNYFLITYDNNEITKEILKHEVKLTEGYVFQCFEWMPNFNPKNFQPKKIIRWINICPLPV